MKTIDCCRIEFATKKEAFDAAFEIDREVGRLRWYHQSCDASGFPLHLAADVADRAFDHLVAAGFAVTMTRGSLPADGESMTGFAGGFMTAEEIAEEERLAAIEREDFEVACCEYADERRAAGHRC